MHWLMPGCGAQRGRHVQRRAARKRWLPAALGGRGSREAPLPPRKMKERGLDRKWRVSTRRGRARRRRPLPALSKEVGQAEPTPSKRGEVCVCVLGAFVAGGQRAARLALEKELAAHVVAVLEE
jgi:hypothetical protein